MYYVSMVCGTLFDVSVLLLLIGLIQPKWVLWWVTKEARNRKKVLVSYILIGAVLLWLSNFTMPDDLKEKFQTDHAAQSCLFQQGVSGGNVSINELS